MLRRMEQALVQPPDTLDFRLRRFLTRHDILAGPGPVAADAQQIADALALALQRPTSSRPPRFSVLFIPLGSNERPAYQVRFDTANSRIVVKMEVPPHRRESPPFTTSWPSMACGTHRAACLEYTAAGGEDGFRRADLRVHSRACRCRARLASSPWHCRGNAQPADVRGRWAWQCLDCPNLTAGVSRGWRRRSTRWSPDGLPTPACGSACSRSLLGQAFVAFGRCDCKCSARWAAMTVLCNLMRETVAWSFCGKRQGDSC